VITKTETIVTTTGRGFKIDEFSLKFKKLNVRCITILWNSTMHQTSSTG